MTDIVERLDRCSPLTIALAHEARDEIRQLREHRDHMRAVVECAGFGSITEALVEIERLQAHLAEAVEVISDLMRISPPGRLTVQASDVDRRARAFLAKVGGPR